MAIESIRDSYAPPASLTSSVQKACQRPVGTAFLRRVGLMLVLFLLPSMLFTFFVLLPLWQLHQSDVVVGTLTVKTLFGAGMFLCMVLLVAHVVRPRRRQDVGTTVVKFGLPPNAYLFRLSALAQLLLGIYFVYHPVQRYLSAENPTIPSAGMIFCYCSIFVGSLFFFVLSLQRTRLTTNGILSEGFFVPWSKLSSYHWKEGASPTLVFELNRGLPSFRKKMLSVRAELREPIQELLDLNQIPPTTWK